ncbi:MAG: LytTR family DNA-binding domain-containing protein [Bacteroidota bacterium]
MSKATGALNQKVANLETPSSPVSDKLFIKADNQIIKLAYDSIITINGQGAYVQIYTTDGRKIMSLQSMSKLEAALPSNFFRTHRSHLVNIDQIDAIDGNMIILGEHKVTLSKNKRKEFFKLIDKANLLGSD